MCRLYNMAIFTDQHPLVDQLNSLCTCTALLVYKLLTYSGSIIIIIPNILPLECWICCVWLQFVFLDLSFSRRKTHCRLGYHIQGKEFWLFPPPPPPCHFTMAPWQHSPCPAPARGSCSSMALHKHQNSPFAMWPPQDYFFPRGKINK